MMKAGDRVKLKANPQEGWEEEFGVILGIEANGTIMVEVDNEYRTECDADGLREVTEDQLELYGPRSVKGAANQ
jgi:hypothetical protein